jgi:RalA-binding protein 1
VLLHHFTPLTGSSSWTVILIPLPSSGPSSSFSTMSLHSPVVSTPIRDRLQPSSAQASPQRPANAPGNGQQVSVEGLLALHASAPDSKLAALEQAVAERNSLSSQNAQLWKLIEKQRAGYTQMLKELERVRSERDSYKTKAGSPAIGEQRRHRSQERTTSRKQNHSLDSRDDGSSSGGEHFTPSRPIVARSVSDEDPCKHSNRPSPRVLPLSFVFLATPRGAHALHSARSQDVLGSNPNHAGPSSFSLTHSMPPSSSADSRTAKLPLAVPARSESLPTSEVPGTRPLHFHHKQDSTASATHNATAPLIYPRKMSMTSDGAPVIVQTGNQTSHQLAGENGNHEHGQPGLNGSHSHSVNHSPTNGLPPPHSQNTLMVINDSLVSRDSRISLPEEAKKYIAAMGDSPIPSPKGDSSGVTVNSHRPVNSTDLPAPQSSPSKPVVQESKSGFLDMDDDDTGDDEEEGEPYEMTGITPPQPAPQFQQPQTPLRKTPHAAAEDFPLPPTVSAFQTVVSPESTPHTYHSPPQPQQSVSPPPQQVQASARGTAGASVDSLQQSMFSSTSSITQIEPSDSDTDTLASYRMPQQTPQQTLPPLQPQRLDSEPQNVPASFRALPLLPTDLPRTRIQVANSYVRPNDRGKEVLFFVVTVNAGNGKEPWKVEKMYSDVQLLDQRIRSSVKKDMLKKIGSLPEGKLWKDHAPAKVDQRKVGPGGLTSTS